MSETVENLDYGNDINPRNDNSSDNDELVEKFEHMGLKKQYLEEYFHMDMSNQVQFKKGRFLYF